MSSAGASAAVAAASRGGWFNFRPLAGGLACVGGAVGVGSSSSGTGHEHEDRLKEPGLARRGELLRRLRPPPLRQPAWSVCGSGTSSSSSAAASNTQRRRSLPIPGARTAASCEAPFSDTRIGGAEAPPRPLPKAWLLDLIGRLKQSRIETIDPATVEAILEDTTECLQKHDTSAVSDVNFKDGRVNACVVVGDLHGQLADLMWILLRHGMPSPSRSYVFNGDLVDRGNESVEVALAVFALKLLHPDTVFINRGNHECSLTNSDYGFRDELTQKYGFYLGNELWTKFNHVFNKLPFATVVGKAFVIHGGLFRDPEVTVETLRQLPLRAWQLEPGAEGEMDAAETMLLDAVWSDPVQENGVHVNKRGDDLISFGPDVTARFLEKNNFELIIRSHEFPESLAGHEYVKGHGDKLVTVFSASNYGGVQNHGCALILKPDGTFEYEEHYAPALEDIEAIEGASVGASANVRYRLMGQSEANAKEKGKKEWQERGFVEQMGELVLNLLSNSDELEAICRQVGGKGKSGWQGKKLKLCEWRRACRTLLERAASTGLGEVAEEVLEWVDLTAGIVPMPYSGKRKKHDGEMCVEWMDAVSKIAEAADTVQVDSIDWVQRGVVLTFDATLRANLDFDSALRLFDTNNNGRVDFDKFQDVLRRLELGLNQELLMAMWSYIIPPANVNKARSLLGDENSAHTSRSVSAAEFWQYYHAAYIAAGGSRLQGSVSGSMKQEEAEGLLELINEALDAASLNSGRSHVQMVFDIFQKADSSADGFIGPSEFTQVLHGLANIVPEALKTKLLHVTVAQAEELFKWLDVSGDGLLGVVEFLNGVLSTGEHEKTLTRNASKQNLMQVGPFLDTLRSACTYVEEMGRRGHTVGSLDIGEFRLAFDLLNFNLPPESRLTHGAARETADYVFQRLAVEESLAAPGDFRRIDYGEACDVIERELRELSNRPRHQLSMPGRASRGGSGKRTSMEGLRAECARVIRMRDQLTTRNGPTQRLLQLQAPSAGANSPNAPSVASKAAPASSPSARSQWASPSSPLGAGADRGIPSSPRVIITPEQGNTPRRHPKHSRHNNHNNHHSHHHHQHRGPPPSPRLATSMGGFEPPTPRLQATKMHRRASSFVEPLTPFASAPSPRSVMPRGNSDGITHMSPTASQQGGRRLTMPAQQQTGEASPMLFRRTSRRQTVCDVEESINRLRPSRSNPLLCTEENLGYDPIKEPLTPAVLLAKGSGSGSERLDRLYFNRTSLKRLQKGTRQVSSDGVEVFDIYGGRSRGMSGSSMSSSSSSTDSDSDGESALTDITEENLRRTKERMTAVVSTLQPLSPTLTAVDGSDVIDPKVSNLYRRRVASKTSDEASENDQRGP
eukprot:TRINITY_DN252_c3_g1_i1.p1 TRINITY_DN252_c3_g1~~TRINITY_DN252_c3_g1_i1.p1  ORF type:complete len:1361 (-),score=321.75 TRINITY_DN252_c3_g1_i1:246-4328(-)